MTEKLFYNKEFERVDTFTAQVVSIDLAGTTGTDSEQAFEADADATVCAGASAAATATATADATADAAQQLRVCVILDQTLFFPEEGGQECDEGYLFALDDAASGALKPAKDAGNKVPLQTACKESFDALQGKICLQVQQVTLQDGVITHRCKIVRYLGKESGVQSEAAGLSVSDQDVAKLIEAMGQGATLMGIIDAHHHLDQMQQHTAEHIISGLIHAAYGYDNVGFHLSERSVTMDYNGVLNGEQVAEIEQKANEVVWQNLPVRAWFPSEDELKSVSYRSKKEIEGEALRLVEIAGVDLCACCAPHVMQTGEIGLIKVTRLQNYKGGVRLSIACGERALRQFTGAFDLLQNLAMSLSTSVENIPDRFRAMQAEMSALKEDLVAFKKEKAGSLLETANVDGEHAMLMTGAEQGNDTRNIVNKLMELHTGYCAVFAGDTATGYRYCLGSKSLDAKIAQTGLQKLYSAKGGGSAQMVQGSIPAGVEIDTNEFSWQKILSDE